MHLHLHLITVRWQNIAVGVTMHNRLTQRLDIAYPIIQAPMAGVSTPELAAAVSNSGGLGSLGLGAATVSQAEALIARTRNLTTGPINVNLFCHAPARRDPHTEARWIALFGQEIVAFLIYKSAAGAVWRLARGKGKMRLSSRIFYDSGMALRALSFRLQALRHAVNIAALNAQFAH